MNFFDDINFSEKPTQYTVYQALIGIANRNGLSLRTDTIHHNERDEDVVIVSISNSRKCFPSEEISLFGNGAYFEIVKETVPDVQICDLQETTTSATSQKWVPKLICLPSKFCFRYKQPKNNFSYNKCAMTKLLDGTLVNLYYYNGEWMLGSKHSFDVRNFEWRGIIYKEEFAHLSQKNSDFSLDSLDKEFTYSLLMCSTNMHPTSDTSDNDNLFFVSAQRIYDGTVEYHYNKEIGIKKVPFVKNTNSKFGTIYRNEVGFDYANRSPEFIQLRKMLYNIPRVPQNMVNDFKVLFRQKDFMILCNISSECDMFLEKVPLLKERASTIAKKVQMIVLTIIKCHKTPELIEKLSDNMKKMVSSFSNICEEEKSEKVREVLLKELLYIENLPFLYECVKEKLA